MKTRNALHTYRTRHIQNVRARYQRMKRPFKEVLMLFDVRERLDDLRESTHRQHRREYV